jgi:hypothetical protein
MCIEFQRPTALQRRNVLEWSGWSRRMVVRMSALPGK